MTKFDALVERLVRKMGMSQTPVPGLILGLSGTDSLVAFMLAYRACQERDMADRVLGVHYINARQKQPTWFQREIIPWLRERCPAAVIRVDEPLGGNYDQQRWADLHMRALNLVEGGVVHSLEPDQRYWVAGTINATEKYLGQYSMLSNSVSIQLVQTLYKSAILEICEEFGVPKIAMENARQPDCFCGRDEIASSNIELIDEIITHRVNPMEHDPVLLQTLIEYVREEKRQNDFKMRVPYLI